MRRASTKTLKGEGAWHAEERARRPVWLEKGVWGDNVREVKGIRLRGLVGHGQGFGFGSE